MTGRDNNTDDKLLSAYLDGELPDDEANALTERLAREPALMRRLEAFRAGDAHTRRLFAALDERPMPQGVLDLLSAHEKEEPADNVLAFPARALRPIMQLPVAIAASVALIAGFVANGLFNQSSTIDTTLLSAGTVSVQSEVYDLLETAGSGETRALQSGGSAEVVLTFEDINGDFCRQARITDAGRTLHGLACRRDGSWQLETLSIGTTRSPGGEYQQASGNTPAAVDAAVDALIGPADALDPEEEMSIISEGWKKSSL